MDKIIVDQGTMREVRAILDRYEASASVLFKQAGRAKREHMMPALRGGPGMYIPAWHVEEIWDEVLQNLRSIIKEMSILGKDSVDMRKALTELINEKAAREPKPVMKSDKKKDAA